MDKFDLELIKQGHPIQMRDGRDLILDYIAENAIWAKTPYEYSTSWLLDGHWQRTSDQKWNGIESCADIILKGNSNIQLNLF